MPRLAFLALAVSLTGCVTDEQATAIQQNWAYCIRGAVARLDDGKTDPVSIAYGAAPQCSSEYQQMTEAEVGQMVTENGQIYRRGLMRDQEVRLATSAVLNYRASKKTANQQ